MKRLLANVVATLAFAVAVPASPMPVAAPVGKREYSREYLTGIVSQVLESMVAHNPYTLPLAQVYTATENSHPAALGMMASWRTITNVSDGVPSLLALDTTNGTAYFALDVSESNDEVEHQSILKGRIKVVDELITEVELLINRARGDHGFSFSSVELHDNYQQWREPPEDRVRATRAELESLGQAAFNSNSTFNVTLATDCQFTEEGWSVVDPGPDGNRSTEVLGCNWPVERPQDPKARVDLVIDEELGIVLVGALVPGVVYPYGNVSAFIPNDMVTAQQEQDAWLAIKLAEGSYPLLAPTAASGETLQLLQYYDNQLQGLQINLHLSGPKMESVWTQ